MYSDNSNRRYNYPSFKMKKKDSDTYSAASGTSGSGGGGGGRKGARLSLQRFFLRPAYLTRAAVTRSAREARHRSSHSEAAETRSVTSLPPLGGTGTGGAIGGAGASGTSITSSHDSHGIIGDTVVTIDPDSLESEAGSTGSSIHQPKLRECPLCLAQLSPEHFPPIRTCAHRSCRECLRQYLRIEISESRVNVACPECAERFHPSDMAAIVADPVLTDKYELFMLRRVLVLDPDTRWCPAPDCTYAVIASGCASCPKLHCERPGCDTWFCYHCKQYWHPNQTCDAARAERNIRSSSLSYSHESSSNSDIKPCPRCSAFIIKMADGSCNHMTCAVCGAEFCWLCMKEISDLHYLSPSGCTFWGRKPWSRKKKILWQLGTLVGAPVGIGLVAGIAVPAMIIGIPVWVGKKLKTKYEHAPKHKRNLIITGGVSASILVSPILAGIAVGIGVPILLAYVYGVVPVSLCRSGGCGVTTTNSGGVRFEFDEDNDVTVGVSGPYSVEDVASPPCVGSGVGGSRVANPSIGPSIGEMSLAAGGSLYSQAVDNDSTRAIAPASLDGASVASGYQTNRLEVQVDVAGAGGSVKRASLTSDSPSLDAKSATVSFGDDASTKALAGSLCTRDRDNNSGIVDVSSSGGAREVGERGSPTSSRSVTFGVLDCTGGAGGVRHKRYKRQSVSIGDSIHEQVCEDLTPVEGGSSELSESAGESSKTASTTSTASAASSEVRGVGGCVSVGVSGSEDALVRGGCVGVGVSGPVGGSEDALVASHPGFPTLDAALGLPPFREDTHRSASELQYRYPHPHHRHFSSSSSSSTTQHHDPRPNPTASAGLDKKRSLSMNDSHCGAGGGGSGAGNVKAEGVSPGGVKSQAHGDDYDATNLSCLTP